MENNKQRGHCNKHPRSSDSSCHTCQQNLSLKSSWACTKCTYENKSDAQICEMCENEKPIFKNEPSTNNTLINSSQARNSFNRFSSKFSLNPSLDTQYISMNVGHRRRLDETEAERTFRHIVEHCRKRRTYYIDDEFPHSQSSLGDEFSQNDCDWVRIVKFRSQHRDDDPTEWTVMSSPEPNDIEQGLLGNCWLVAALALIAERPYMLKHILLTQTVNDEGVYLVRLCHNGEWKTVVVDDAFPCSEDDKLLFTKARRRQLYIPLIEKACAKLFGSYSKLISGHIEEGLQLFTGAPCDHIDLQNNDEPDLVWLKLLSGCESDLLIGAATCRTDVKQDVYDQYKIHGNHAFSILAAYSLENSSDRFILLRDPHGLSSYRDRHITPEILQILRSQTRHEVHCSTGTFWMEWKKFLRFFSRITISTYRDINCDLREHARFSRSSIDPISVFHFHISERAPINISVLYHRPDRLAKEILTQSFVLCNVDDESININEQNLILHSEYGPNLAWSGSLTPGSYFIIPFSISFWHRHDEENLIDRFTLVIQSSIQIDGLLCDGPPTFLADCLIRYVMKNCEKPTEYQDTRFYTTDPNQRIAIMVAENQSNEDYLNFDMDMSQSINVRVSRNSLFTNDCILPGHRQLICIVEFRIQPEQASCLYYVPLLAPTKNFSESFPPIDTNANDLHSLRQI